MVVKAHAVILMRWGPQGVGKYSVPEGVKSGAGISRGQSS